ncbi:hypothetical protein FD28_GL000598 [Levilactobacillus hammesii DSM 16381]|uniref:Uncharacterized protein n=1 Tax=Levilactobacillus hammesii DSM 16381 TaxID=1423753 RepID=A0A0R1USX3_9LACO|nr:hypothetical protein FD28_GL000598 [Levilactobacillus hammesii DSM 16381]
MLMKFNFTTERRLKWRFIKKNLARSNQSAIYPFAGATVTRDVLPTARLNHVLKPYNHGIYHRLVRHCPQNF